MTTERNLFDELLDTLHAMQQSSHWEKLNEPRVPGRGFRSQDFRLADLPAAAYFEPEESQAAAFAHYFRGHYE